MRYVLSALLLGATVVHAADQAILGTQLLVKDPSTAEKRKVIGKAKEKASENTLVGDPTVDGATLTVRADGATHRHPLPQLGRSDRGDLVPRPGVRPVHRQLLWELPAPQPAA